MPVKFYPHNPIAALEKIIVKEDGTPLNGEIEVYRKLNKDLGESSEEWFVWHDLKLPTHSDHANYYKKVSAQIDFLVLCKEGIVVIEVKGGAISTYGNKFYYGKNFDSPMKQNPFQQAEGYKFTLKDNILNNVKSCFFCDVVVFPHVTYAFASKLIDKNLLWTEYVSSEHDNSIEKFLKSVFKYTKKKHSQHFRTYSNLTSKEIGSIIKILSPIIHDKNKYKSINTLQWLGIQNIEILEGLYRNSRVMIEGPPGSGKTTIAKAFIDKQIGKKGIYLCWNNLLMHSTKNLLSDRENTKSIEVTTFFRFLQKHNPKKKYKEIAQLTEQEFYELLANTLESIDIDSNCYDFIVIDEGQDVFDRGLDIFINKLCGYNQKGLTTGNALILYDIDQSYALGSRPTGELAELLGEYFSHFKLNEIKRSAQSPDIRLLSSAVLDDPKLLISEEFSRLENINFIKHKSLKNVKKHLVTSVLDSIRAKTSSLKGKDCVVLVESTLLRENYKGEPNMHYELAIRGVEELTDKNVNDKSNVLKYTSILKFKGLESKNVFLIVTEPSEDNKYELFVGITRAISNVEINIVA